MTKSDNQKDREVHSVALEKPLEMDFLTWADIVYEVLDIYANKVSQSLQNKPSN